MTPLIYYAFDVLMLAGRDVTGEALDARRALLEAKVLPKLAEPIRYSPELQASLKDLIASVKAQGFEGLVGKNRNSRYEPGLRSGAWRKMRINQARTNPPRFAGSALHRLRLAYNGIAQRRTAGPADRPGGGRMYVAFRTLVAVTSLLLLLLAFACSNSRHEANEKYYLVASNIKIAYWQGALAGLNRAATDLKVRAEMAGSEKYDPQAERDQFRQVVSAKPAGIMLSAADPELMRGEIDAAIAAGIPVITMDSDAPDSRRLFFIGTNNYQAGVSGGRVLAQRLNHKGNIVVFTIPTQDNLIERLRGYQDVLANTDIKIVQIVDVRGDPALAFDKTMEIIQSGKLKVDGFVCLEATAGKEVADVLARRKISGKAVIAMDADDDTLNWIEKGGIVATVAQKPFTMAYYGLHLLDDLHHHKPARLDADWRQDLRAVVPSVVDTGSSLIDRTNVSAVRRSAMFETAGTGAALAWSQRHPFAASLRGTSPTH
jgi:ribose transport system substrate-binding protein